jgi:hypothetical protein
MSQGKTNLLASEIEGYLTRYGSNKWMLAEVFVQLCDREKILAINKERKRHGEAEIIPEPQRYKEQNHSWIIDVPKSWVSLVSKDNQS